MKKTNNYSVYKHTAPNGKVYIGITSKKCEYRWDKGRGYVQNEHFYAAIKKYGWENIKHEVLYTELSKEEAEKTEIALIREYKSNDRRCGYNIQSGGNAGVSKHSPESIEKMRMAKLGKKASEETRRKLSEIRKGRSIPEETREKISAAQRGVPRKKATEEQRRRQSERQIDNVHNMRPVCRYSMDGEFIDRFVSAKNAERATGADAKNIAACCRGKRKSAFGYVWKYENEENENKHAIGLTGKKNGRSRAIKRFDLSGRFVDEKESANLYATEMGLTNASDIIQVCKGKRKTAHGYIWRYAKSEEN